MLFGKEFMDEINRSNRSLRQQDAPFTIIYKPGYMKDDENYHKNVLSKWEIVDVKEKELFIQLTFSKPVYVAAGDFRCTLELSFGDGKKFLSAGLSEPLEPDQKKIIILHKQKPNDNLTKGLAAVAPQLKAAVQVMAAAAGLFIAIFSYGAQEILTMIAGL